MDEASNILGCPTTQPPNVLFTDDEMARMTEQYWRKTHDQTQATARSRGYAMAAKIDLLFQCIAPAESQPVELFWVVKGMLHLGSFDRWGWILPLSIWLQT